LAVTVPADWVTVAFQPLTSPCPGAAVQVSVHPVTAAAPVLVRATEAVNPPDHELSTVYRTRHAVPLGRGEALGDTDRDGDAETDRDGDAETDREGDAETDRDGDADGERDGDTDGLATPLLARIAAECARNTASSGHPSPLSKPPHPVRDGYHQ
jgi:hypothetical protein